MEVTAIQKAAAVKTTKKMGQTGRPDQVTLSESSGKMETWVKMLHAMPDIRPEAFEGISTPSIEQLVAKLMDG